MLGRGCQRVGEEEAWKRLKKGVDGREQMVGEDRHAEAQEEGRKRSWRMQDGKREGA